MTKLAILSFFGGLGYFCIQYYGGWMIFIPMAQQISIAFLSLLLCLIGDKLLRIKLDFKLLLIAPIVSFLILTILHKGELGLLYGTSLLNLLAFMLVICIYKRLNGL